MDDPLYSDGGDGARRTRRRVVGVTLLLVVVALLVVGRVDQMARGQDGALREGAAHLAAALAGDDTAWDDAEAAFQRAMRRGVFDTYPIFALDLTRRLRRGATSEFPPALRPAVEAVARGDLDGAEAALDDAASGDAAEALRRLLGHLRAAGDG